MAVIVDFIEDVFDAIGDAIDWVVNDVIKPVVNGIGDIIQYALDNPIEAIAKAAAIATGQLWAIPLIDGAKVLAEGGDFGDALKAAAISYVSTTVGNVAGTYTSAALAKAGVSATVSNIISAGTKSATTALVYGQDPIKAFATGGLNAAVAASIGWVDQKLNEQFGESFADLRGGVKDSIFAGIAAEIEGGNVSTDQMTKIIGKYTGVSKFMNDFLMDNAGFSDTQAAILTNAVSSAVSKAIAGNPDLSGEAFFGSISKAGADALKKIIDKPVNKAIDKVSGAYKNTEESANALNGAITNAENAANQYNTLQSQLAGRLATQDQLKSAYDTAIAAYNANQTEANANAANAAAKAFNDYVLDLEQDYNTNYKNQLDFWESEFNKFNSQIPDLEAAYQEDLDWMVTTTEDLETTLQPKLTEADRAVTLALRPNFDEEAYREAAGLPPGADVYGHYLENGQALPTDRVAVDTALDTARFQLVQNALANQGVDWASLEPEQMEAALDYAKRNVRSLTGITGLDFDGFAVGATAAAENATPSGAAYPTSYNRASGVTDTDIASGSAVLYNNDGTLEWRKSETIRNDLNGTTVNVEQNSDGTLRSLVDTALQSPDGTATSASGGITIRLPNSSGGTTTDNSATLRNIVQAGLDGAYLLPELIINQVVSLDQEAGRLLDEYVGKPIYEAASNLYNTFLKGTTAGNALENTASVVTGATGELLQAASGLALLVGANPDNAVGRLADRLLNASDNLRTEGYAATAEEIDRIIGDAEGWRDKARAIWDVATSGDTAAVFFAEYVGKELLQEIPVLLVSGGAGNVAKRALQEAGEQAAQRYAARVGVGTAITLDMVEAFGGTAAGAYDEAYATALRVGMSEQEANEYAIEVGQKAGAIATVLVGVTAGVGGAAFEKAILGEGAQDVAMRSMYDAFRDRLIEGGTVTIKEGVTEGIEEALPQFYVAMSLAQIDPTYDVSGEVMAAALLGKIAGAGTAAGIYTGYAAVDALYSTSLEVQNAVNLNGGSNPDAVRSALADLGINDEVAQNNLLSIVNDQFHSNGDVSRAFSAHPDFRVTNADILNGVLNSAGQDVTTYVNTYVDQRYVDIDEVKAAAAAEGVTLTDAQAQDMVTQTNDPNATQAALYSIQQKYDPQGVTAEEARQRFAELGFTPTDAQVNEFVGQNEEVAQLNKINAYVDPRQVTEAEARQFFDALGYTPTDQEVRDFVGQGNEDFEATAPDRVGTYVDPRQVTEDEARQFFTDLGYTPTDEQVAEFVAQVEETTQQDVISKYVDPRQVTMDELQAIADEEGLTLTEALAQTYIGQSEADTFQQEQLAAARTEYDPLATTLEEATQFFADTGYSATPEEIAEFVASKTEEAQTSAIGAYVDPRQVTAAEAEEFLSAIGYQPTQEEINQFVGQVNDANFEAARRAEVDEYVDPRFFDAGEIRAAYEELGLVDVTQEDVDRFVGQYDPETMEFGPEGFESARMEELRTYMPTATFNAIKSVLGSPAIPDDPNTPEDESKAATGIYAELAEGATRDEAMQEAIDQLAERLGITEAEVLEQIGLTRDELGAEIDAVAEDVAAVKEEVTGLGDQITDVETAILDRMDEMETEGIARDEALGTAISDLATELGLTEEALLGQLGLTEESLLTEIGAAEERLGTQFTDDLQFVANLVGKPARDVTQVDVDFVADLIAQQEVITDLTTAQRQYDVTGDGLINQDDFTLLEQALAGTDVTFAPDSVFGPATGLYAQQEQNLAAQLAAETETQNLIDQQIQNQTELATQLQTQLQTQDEMARRRAFGDFVRQQQDMAGQRVDVRTPDPMRINYLYDFQSIFATPQQASLFPTPYAEGGQVEGTTDKLLRIIGELK